jgi:cytochrome oxidase assembly protein ShyY1
MPSPEVVTAIGTWATALLLATFVWQLRRLNRKLDVLKALILRQNPTPVRQMSVPNPHISENTQWG